MKLKEELVVNENKLIIYHRTKKANVQNILNTGKIMSSRSSSSLYGQGVYGTTNLESQFGGKMHTFGDAILKLEVNGLNKFLIFDKELARLVYGLDYNIAKQIKKLNVKVDKRFFQKFKEFNDIALAFVEYMNMEGLNKVNGIIYSGNDFDGDAAVVYDQSLINVISYSYDEGKTFQPVKFKNINITKINRRLFYSILQKESITNVQYKYIKYISKIRDLLFGFLNVFENKEHENAYCFKFILKKMMDNDDISKEFIENINYYKRNNKNVGSFNVTRGKIQNCKILYGNTLNPFIRLTLVKDKQTDDVMKCIEENDFPVFFI